MDVSMTKKHADEVEGQVQELTSAISTLSAEKSNLQKYLEDRLVVRTGNNYLI
jgi:hypothetical protein